MPLTKRSLLLVVCLVVSMSAVVSTLSASVTHAVDPNTFNPGRIIDDGIFTNKNAMGWEAIQRFFNSKGVNCQNNQAPCLKNFSEGGKTAAQIIFDAGQEYNINPQVLIVLIQKEAGIVTATAPQNWQYRTAAGYACPDSTPGVCNASYLGFTNQVRSAARMFNNIMTANPNWYTPYIVGTNSILWNPNSACGRSTVVIQNRATQALYNYTPYRPNQAALNAGYGTGDGCSSYGNRNFFLYFNDWFGISSSPLIRSYDSGALYFYDGTRRYYIPTLDTISQYGIDGSYVRFISQAEMNAIPNGGGTFSPMLNRLIKSSTSGGIYLLDRATKLHIGSMEQLADMGYTTDMITILPPEIAESYPLAPNSLSYFFQAPSGAVTKLVNKKKRSIFEQAVLDNEIQGSSLSRLSEYNLNFWQQGDPIVYTDYLARNAAGAIRYYSSTSYKYVPSMESYNCWNLGAVKVFQVDFSLTLGEDTGPMTCVAQNGSGSTYLMSGGNKYSLPSQTNLDHISTVSDTMLSRIPTASLSTAIHSPSGAISVLENNQKRPVQTMEIFYKLGLTPATMTFLSRDAYDALRTTHNIYPAGTLVRDQGGNAYVISGTTSKKHIASIETFYDYGYRWETVIPISNADSSYYATEPTPLSNVVNDTSTNDKYLLSHRAAYKLTTATGTPALTYQSVSPGLLDRANKVTDLVFAVSPNGAVYKLDAGTKHYVGSWQSYLQHSNNGAQKIYPLSQAFLDAFTTDAPI